jgi:hypothetical protein
MTANHTPLSSIGSSSSAQTQTQDRLRLLFDTDNWSADDLSRLAHDLAQSVQFARELGGVPDVDLVAQARTWVGGDLTVQGRTQSQQVDRLITSKFWRRALRQKIWRAIETGYLKRGAVGGQTGKMYVSDFTSKIKRQMDEQQQDWLAASRVEATIDGELVSLPLAELHDKNQNARLAEFLAWSAGFQKLADKLTLETSMLTLTLPGVFHANPLYARKNDEEWNGTTPAAANKKIGEYWAQVRASLLQQNITLSGFRSAEPMQDATPHWHLCIAYPPAQRGRVMCEIMKLFSDKLKLIVGRKGVPIYFDAPDNALAGRGRPAKKENEGAQAELTVVDTSGGANALVSYVIKYVTKFGMNRTQPLIKKLREQQANIACELETATGQLRGELVQKLDALTDEIKKLEQEEEKEDSTERHLVSAWRACWGVRGVQWFGIRNALTPWRELRRINEKKFIHQGIERALWNRARAGDAAGFLELLGGLAAAPISKQASCRSKMRSQTNQFGQVVNKIIGVVVRDEIKQTQADVITRPYQWTLITEYPQQAQSAPVAQQMAAQLVVAQPIVAQGVFNFNLNGITVIPNTPSKPLNPKTNPKPKTKTPKTAQVGIKPQPKPPDKAHRGAQNAARP